MSIRLTALLLGGLLLTAGAAVWKMGTSRPVARIAGPVPGSVQDANAATGSDERVKFEQDKTVVFQRAFWRGPGAGDQVLHGERRDWLDATAAVRKWQWFVAVAPSPEFRRWLLDENPFELVRSALGGDAAATDSPPAWFPSADSLARFAQYRARGSRFVVFDDPTSGRIFAADAGLGFAAAAVR